jgi:hypothetical protein
MELILMTLRINCEGVVDYAGIFRSMTAIGFRQHKRRLDRMKVYCG